MLILNDIINDFKNVASPEAKAWRERYMRNQFLFYGVTKAQINLIAESLIKVIKTAQSKSTLINYVEALWALAERENQYLAMHLLVKCKALLDANDAPWIIEALVKVKPWWDTIDTLRNVLAFILDAANQTFIAAKIYAQNEHLWVRRISLLLGPASNQVSLKQHCQIIKRVKNDSNFFIQKAIGWSLRDYAKIDMESVIKVIANLKLEGLAKREALKHYKGS